MKVAIDKVLEKKHQEEKKKITVDPVNEVKLLLEGDKSEDLRILRGLSKNSQLSRVEHLNGKKLELEKLETSYEGKVYTKDEIEELAVDYKLRFLPSMYYTGSFDVEVAAKIKEFAKKTLSPIDEWSLGRRYFVLAPEQMFELKDVRYVTKKELDPAIFFQIDENHYRLIHKWGSDFTIFRLLTGYRFKSWWHHQWFNTITVFPIVAFIFALMCSVHFISNHPIWFTLMSLTVSFLFSYFRWGFGKHDDGDKINGFFTPHNWNSDSKIKR